MNRQTKLTNITTTTTTKCQMSKNIHRRLRMLRVRIGGTSEANSVKDFPMETGDSWCFMKQDCFTKWGRTVS